MAFTVDYSKASQYYNVQDGEYETVITGAGWDKTVGGTEYVKVKLRVRDDVKQNEQGEMIEYPLWKSKPDNSKPSDIDGIVAWKIQQISKAAQLAEGIIPMLWVPFIDNGGIISKSLTKARQARFEHGERP